MHEFTLRYPDEIHRRARIMAARLGTTIKNLMIDAMEAHLTRLEAQQKPRLERGRSIVNADGSVIATDYLVGGVDVRAVHIEPSRVIVIIYGDDGEGWSDGADVDPALPAVEREERAIREVWRLWRESQER